MRVLVCHNYYQQRGGEDQVFEDEAWMLRERGHDVIQFEMNNHVIHGMKRTDIIRKTFWNAEVEKELQQKIGQFRPHVVHCINFFPLISPAVCQVAVSMGCAMVQVLQNYRLICPNAQLLRNHQPCQLCIGKRFAWPAIVHGCYREDRMATSVVAGMLSYHRWRRTWDRFVDRFIVPSHVTCQKYVEAGFPAEKIAVKPNFLRPDPGAGDGAGDYAIFVGRLSVEKGLLTLLDAWKKVPGNRRLVIVGDGPLADAVTRAAASDSRIQWQGRLPLEQVCRQLGSATFSIMPSIWHEPFGRTVIESFAVGTPVLASRMGAMSELILENETGRFFRPGDADDLALKAVEMFADSTLSETGRRLRVRQEYLNKYTAEKNCVQLIAIYNDAIEAHLMRKQISS
ncbi:MAG: glycosyltransferase [Pirellulaceae bacterium]|nr:glycosyltransferase [Pirellulaceae bacterium]